MPHQTITITFGDRAENHVGMQKIGQLAENGFSIQDLENAKIYLENKGCTCNLISLNDYLDVETDPAKILIIKDGVNVLLSDISKTADDLFDELKGLDWDKKAKMYGRVVNKHARYNLCLDYQGQEPDYQDGKGRIVPYEQVPLSKHIKDQLGEIINGGDDLTGELNNYQDIRQMGIGFHGDAERLKVIAVRVGEPLPIHYQWFYKGLPVGERAMIGLGHGDMYIMSQKTTGNDWKKKNCYTLRHATGCNKFTTI